MRAERWRQRHTSMRLSAAWSLTREAYGSTEASNAAYALVSGAAAEAPALPALRPLLALARSSEGLSGCGCGSGALLEASRCGGNSGKVSTGAASQRNHLDAGKVLLLEEEVVNAVARAVGAASTKRAHESAPTAGMNRLRLPDDGKQALCPLAHRLVLVSVPLHTLGKSQQGTQLGPVLPCTSKRCGTAPPASRRCSLRGRSCRCRSCLIRPTHPPWSP